MCVRHCAVQLFCIEILHFLSMKNLWSKLSLKHKCCKVQDTRYKIQDDFIVFSCMQE